MTKRGTLTLKLTVAAFALCGFTASAQAHIIIEGFQGRANYNEFLTLMVPHGCGVSDTTELRMRIPGNIPLFVPEEKAGWETELVMRKLDAPITRGNRTITEVYDEVIWRGHLPTAHLGVFKFMARIIGPVDSVVPFRVIQTCGETQDRWIDVVADGEPGWKMFALDAPAPFIVIVEGDGPQRGASSEEIGAERQRLGIGSERQ